jgi:hypothetical protein
MLKEAQKDGAAKCQARSTRAPSRRARDPRPSIPENALWLPQMEALAVNGPGGDGPLGERKRETVPNGGKAMGNRLILPGDGPPCPTCGRSTQIREHRQITADLVVKPCYFRRWFCCVNRRCKTKLIMRNEFKIVANNGRVVGRKKYMV